MFIATACRSLTCIYSCYYINCMYACVYCTSYLCSCIPRVLPQLNTCTLSGHRSDMGVFNVVARHVLYNIHNAGIIILLLWHFISACRKFYRRIVYLVRGIQTRHTSKIRFQYYKQKNHTIVTIHSPGLSRRGMLISTRYLSFKFHN